MSWYDVSVGPNLALFNHVRRRRRPRTSTRSSRRPCTARTRGRRSTRWSASGTRATHGGTTPRSPTAGSITSSRARTTGCSTRCHTCATTRWAVNKWQTSDTWPPRGAQPLTFFLTSGGKANTMNGDGALVDKGARQRQAGRLHLRPDEPGALVRWQCVLSARARRRVRWTSARWKCARTSWSTRPLR